MTKLFVLMTLLFSMTALAQKLEVGTPTLFDGVTYFNFWMTEEQKVEKLPADSLYKKMVEHGLDVLSEPKDKVLWSEFKNGSVYYYFFTDINAGADKAFYVQRIKKTVEYYRDGESTPYKVEKSSLVEAFKTWKGITGQYEYANGRMKKADRHFGIFDSLGRGKTKRVYKEFETGVAIIKGLAEDTSVWNLESGSLYWGTGYVSNNKYYDQVEFSESFKWTLNVEVYQDGYKVESPELNLFEKL